MSQPHAATLPKQTATILRERKDRKFDLIMFGNDEYAKGTPKYFRIQYDLNSPANVFAKIDPAISNLSVCVTLKGKAGMRHA